MLAARMQAAASQVGGGGVPMTEYRFFGDNPTPANTDVDDTDPSTGIALGMTFYFLDDVVDGEIRGAYIYIDADLTGTIDVSLMSWVFNNIAGHTVLKTENFAVSGSGWQRFEFTDPVPLNYTSGSGIVYQIWYRQTGGTAHYAVTGSYSDFVGSGITVGGFMFAPPTGEATDYGTGNGAFKYDPSSASDYPNSTFGGANYWVDPIVAIPT